MNVDFPITVKQFCEMQDQLAGRRTSEDWLEVFEVAVSTINGYYEMGKHHAPEREVFDTETAVQAVAGSPECEKIVRQFAHALACWCRLAYTCGERKLSCIRLEDVIKEWKSILHIRKASRSGQDWIPPLSAISKNERPRCGRGVFPTLPLFNHEGTNKQQIKSALLDFV